MSALQIYFLGVLLIISSILIIVVVLLQESRSSGLSGAIAGGAETFFGKNKGRTIEAKLCKSGQSIFPLHFFIIALAGTLLLFFIK